MNKRSWFVPLVCLIVATPAHAAFHLIKIVEVYPGSATNPSSDAVVLQMYFQGQSFVSGHAIQVYDGAGSLVGTYTFPANVANGANQAKILIATSGFQTEFGLTADLTMSTATISPSGGKVCFETFDCVTWGNYAGSGPVGTPVASPAGIPSGQSIARDIGPDGVLSAADDTDHSANDFDVVRPAPLNNAGNGCGDGNLDLGEQCDDGNLVATDGCDRCGVGPTGVGDAPAASRLRAAPNPFSADVALQFTLAEEGAIELRIYDLAGRRVRELRETRSAGSQRVTWDGRDDAGHEVPGGLYLVRMRAPGLESSARLLRMR